MPPDDAATTPLPLAATYDQLLALITGRATPADGTADAERLVVSDARAGAAARVHVYQHMYRSRIVEALASQFPRLARWLGADGFADLASAYIDDWPSRHPSLRFIGQRLPGWLAARPPADGRHAALADLARLEWARTDVFDAADDTAMALDVVRAWPVDRFAELPLRLIAAHRRLEVGHPVAALWDAIGPGPAADPAATPEPNQDLDAAVIAAGRADRQSLLVWRQGVAIFHRAVDDAERAALDQIAAGTTFGVVCDGLLEARSPEEATAQAFAWLSTWSNDELVAAPP